MTIDECFGHLKALSGSKNDNAMALAESYVDEFAAAAGSDPMAAVAGLGELQARVLKDAVPSPVRSDILDLIGTRVTTLLERH